MLRYVDQQPRKFAKREIDTDVKDSNHTCIIARIENTMWLFFSSVRLFFCALRQATSSFSCDKSAAKVAFNSLSSSVNILPALLLNLDSAEEEDLFGNTPANTYWIASLFL